MTQQLAKRFRPHFVFLQQAASFANSNCHWQTSRAACGATYSQNPKIKLSADHIARRSSQIVLLVVLEHECFRALNHGSDAKPCDADRFAIWFFDDEDENEKICVNSRNLRMFLLRNFG
jgi:hypothetical protein